MYRKYSFPFFARALSFILLFSIPARYIPGLVPGFLLPALSVLAIALGALFERTKLQSFFSALLSSISLLAVFGICIRISGSFHTPRSDVFFMHFGQSFWILFLVCAFSCVSTILYLRAERWRRKEPLVLILVLCAFFWSQGNHTLTLMDHPVKAALFAFAFMLSAILQCACFRPQTLRSLLPLLCFILLFIAGTYFIVRSYNSLSVSNNGGLIQPTMFRFDFSPYLSLQDEIKVNNNLVLIVRTKEENTSTLLRRIYLAGWNPRKGFYESSVPGESGQIKQVPASKTLLPHPDFLLRNPVDQEYFIVNFDPSSLIAMDYPVSVTPYRIWDSTSFSGAYSVISSSTGFIPFELFDSTAPVGTDNDGMPPETLAYYTRIDDRNLSRLKPLSESITSGIPGYYDRILALTAYLHDGDFRYSLKPGTAPDGDQLGRFLFETKKGYCTYFAFSLCLMLRSMGIPSRVAAGFFIQPDSGALDYYPVRANMAHAWVEVFFPKYGWISFDPTTTMVAEGENIDVSANPGGDEFMNLLNEIIGNREFLVPETGADQAEPASRSLQRFFSAMMRSIRDNLPGILASVFAILLGAFIALRMRLRRLTGNPRRKILRAAAKMYRRLDRSSNHRALIRSLKDPEAEDLFRLEQKAKFAPQCTGADAERAETLLPVIKKRYRRNFPFLCLAFAYIILSGSNVQLSAQDQKATEQADSMLSRAENAILAENWENAISIISEGIALYPENPKFRKTLGTLYFDQGLYESAYTELRKALELGYQDTNIYSNLSDTAGYLNREEEALTYLKQYLSSVPDDLFAWSNYGWLCYKTHRLDDGIASLHRVIDAYGPDGNLYVGLANLYTAAFNYTEAKRFYTLAINIAEERKQPYLSSIYYYNRSILEEIFYNFADAYDDTERSIEQSPRSSGYLMQGELELRKLDFRKALNHYLKAYSLDSTPLAAIGLADTLVQAGHAAEAYGYIESIRNKSDMSWIANYGTTTNQYQADLHKSQEEYYKFLKNREKRKVIHSLSTLLLNIKNQMDSSLRIWYHDTICRMKNTQVARHYTASNNTEEILKGQNLFINSYYFLAFNKWRQTGLPYLREAEKIENSYIPAAKPSYLYEKGTLTRDTGLLDEAIRTLDPVWERQYLVKALAERIKLTKKDDRAQKNKYCIQLFELNPAAFIAQDILLPVSFEGDREFNKIRKYICQTGFVKDASSPLRIKLYIQDEEIYIILFDTNSNITFYTQKIHKSPHYQQELPDLINKFSTDVFSADLGI